MKITAYGRTFEVDDKRVRGAVDARHSTDGGSRRDPATHKTSSQRGELAPAAFHNEQVRGGVGGGAIERDSPGNRNSRERVANPAPAPPKYDSKWEERYAKVGHYAQVNGQPIGKPRMTQSDKWKKRACVVQYREWADKARQDAFGSETQRLTLEYPTVLSVTAYIQPSGKAKHAGPHTHKPDGDNIMKAVKDALFTNDQMVYRETIVKWWASDSEPARVEILWTEVPGHAAR